MSEEEKKKEKKFLKFYGKYTVSSSPPRSARTFCPKKSNPKCEK